MGGVCYIIRRVSLHLASSEAIVSGVALGGARYVSWPLVYGTIHLFEMWAGGHPPAADMYIWTMYIKLIVHMDGVH